MAKVFNDTDIDTSWLSSQSIAVLGYGSQGSAQAQNLRDSGLSVIIGQRLGPSFDQAVAHGFAPVSITAAVEEASVVMLTLPDVSMAKIYDAEIRTKLHSGHTLLFTHGYGIHFGGILPPPDVDVALVAPKGPGAGLRSESLNGSGLPCLIAVYQNISGNAKKTALAYAQAIGCSKRGIFETTFEEECVTDLFGEQTVLCGGLSELVKAGFETLVKAGYQPELAYFECLHETRLVVDLLVKRGIAGMLEEISDTAEYGAVTAGTQIVTPQTRKAMEQILEHIRSGTFAKRMTSAAIDGLASSRQQLRATEIEMVGERVRKIIGILE